MYKNSYIHIYICKDISLVTFIYTYKHIHLNTYKHIGVRFSICQKNKPPTHSYI
jgi:hypothetical protein